MQSSLKSDSPISAIKSTSISPVIKPVENKFKMRSHKRSQSQNLNFSNKLKSNDEQVVVQNNIDKSSNNSSSALSSHKRSFSKDQMKKFSRKLPFPLLTSKTMYFNQKLKRMTTQLEIVEDTDEKNSTSQCTSARQNNQKDSLKSKGDHKTRQSKDFSNDNDINVSIDFNEDDASHGQRSPLKTILIPK